jgi:S-methylmethionine-dependent homocysteine/selenocysteine methylase
MRSRNCFEKILALQDRKAIILDGGFGTELERQGKNYAKVMES